jgi:hypothetical protein
MIEFARRACHRLASFTSLPAGDALLLVRTAFVMATVRIALGVAPFSFLIRVLERLGKPVRPDVGPNLGELRRIVWSVEVAGRQFPGGASCLTRSLAAQFLLGRRGYRTTLHIGVARREKGLAAHAWLDSAGAFNLGSLGSGSDAYVPLYPTELSSHVRVVSTSPGSTSNTRTL